MCIYGKDKDSLTYYKNTVQTLSQEFVSKYT